MNRRGFLAAISATAVALTVGRVLGPPLPTPRPRIWLWDGAPPGGGGPGGAARLSARGALSQIVAPYLEVFSPEKPNGQAILVAAGGGYQRIEMGKEAWPAATWLMSQGYTAYVLAYRLPGEGWHDGNRVALQDAQRALRLIRHREQRVGVLGFSAGGHLLGMAALRHDPAYTPRDKLDTLPMQADHAALIYPVITLEKPYQHTATHRVLVGRDATPAAEAEWSVQSYVSRRSPRFFLVQAEDDMVSDPHNTLIMAQACQRVQVPVEMRRYPVGGHGFGLGEPGTPVAAWPSTYLNWLRQ
ncbi:alpha/beta hydrolase [Dickeya poaceiphila]|uniref:Alpha/beta hydrolase n=1 Tax=Dickeya poaceiphila TaxID=568768 RepID=A0A5B8HLX1_9GAMM|nr:alpha/beta hydrolase [Dickeya poaceiphila]QDX30435.1 alpha/beta hydrolase [Dickeya poaceiphila]